MFEYKLLPVPAPAKKAKGRKTMPERFAFALSETLNQQAKDNWLFSHQEAFACEEKGGMMAKDKTVELRYLIFKREVGMEEMPLDQKLEKMRERKAETVVQAPAAPAPIPEPFPEPMQSPQSLGESIIANGEEPTRIFSPFSSDANEAIITPVEPVEDAIITPPPEVGPAKKD